MSNETPHRSPSEGKEQSISDICKLTQKDSPLRFYLKVIVSPVNNCPFCKNYTYWLIAPLKVFVFYNVQVFGFGKIINVEVCILMETVRKVKVLFLMKSKEDNCLPVRFNKHHVPLPSL